MSAWKLTIRHGSDVSKQEYDQLEDAISAAKRSVGEITAEGPLPGISALRDFDSHDRVHARIEISGPGLLRAPTAGIDVRGDGSLIAYRGALRREELNPGSENVFDALRSALEGAR